MLKSTLAIDVSGGDHGAQVTVPAAINFLRKNKTATVKLVGIEQQIKPFIVKLPHQLLQRIEVVAANEVVAMDEQPGIALRRKRNSSMRIALDLVKSNVADACVSSGNTGALMAMAHFVLKTIKGLDRPAIMGMFPTRGESEINILDLGANVSATSNNLLQFALLASIIVKTIHGTNPKVALLNVGHEDIKGTQEIKDAAVKIAQHESINYVGYVEADKVFLNYADIIVCDGFVGNVMLKACEGMVTLMYSKIKAAIYNSPIFAFLARGILRKILHQAFVNYSTEHRSGALFVGLNGIVVKSHGNAGISAFEHAIELAYKYSLASKKDSYNDKVKSLFCAEELA